MKQSALRQIIRLLAFVALMTPSVSVSAGSTTRAIQGDWRLQIDIDGQEVPSILSLSKNADSTLKGEWLCFWGITELRDIKYEGRQLSFEMTIRLDDGDADTKFSGSVKQGELSGVFSNYAGDYKARGKRIKRIPMAAGTWETKLKLGDREFNADLIVKADAQGKLSANWKSQYGEHEITNVQFKAGKLSFDRKSNIQDRQWESSFEGTLKGHTLSGTIKSDRGEIALEGRRVGALVIGQWELDVKFGNRTRKELLRVFPDLSARYGAISIEKVDLDDKDLTFKTSLEVGYETLDISFAGRIKGRKLTGEITSSMGAAEVTGEKRRLTPAARQKNSRVTKTAR